MEKLLSRDEFREQVFSRDNHMCVVCGNKEKLDAHHIIERRLFTEEDQKGGYFLSNGATLCDPTCHMKAETTEISPEYLREIIGITHTILPNHLYDDFEYTKWGDIILGNGMRLKGELFYDESVQKIIQPFIHLYSKYWKHPRLHHLPWSDSLTSDDRILPSIDHFVGKEVLVTTKEDGEQCLSGETLIHTNVGTIMIKEACERNDVLEVLSYDHKQGIVTMQPILAKKVSDNSSEVEWFEIETEDGKLIRVTGNHLIFVPEYGCYRRVDDLKEGEEVFSHNDNSIKLTKIEIKRIDNNSKLYDIQVSENSNYFAGNILVHNSTIYNDYTHARSIDGPSHASRNLLKSWASTWQYGLSDNQRICGENVYAQHSIKYDENNPRPHHFMGFSMWEDGKCLSWDETLENFSILGITPVTQLYRGVFDENLIRSLYNDSLWDTMEGYVVRIVDSFEYKDFKTSVAKYVRKNHVQTAKHHWRSQKVIPNVFRG